MIILILILRIGPLLPRAPGRRGRHLPVQLSGDDPAVDVPAGVLEKTKGGITHGGIANLCGS